MSLTDLACRRAKSGGGKPIKLADDKGLDLLVKSSGPRWSHEDGQGIQPGACFRWVDHQREAHPEVHRCRAPQSLPQPAGHWSTARPLRSQLSRAPSGK